MVAIYDMLAAKLIASKAQTSPPATMAEIIEANDSLSTRFDSLTAIFTGATNGVGLGTLRVFINRIPHPRAIIVGRDRDRFDEKMKNLMSSNPTAELTFVEGNLGTIKGVDAVCDKIQHELANTKADLLCMSQGYAPIQGRDYNAEGLDLLLVLVYYGRMRMIQNLIEAPTLKPTARIVSILAGTFEGKIFEDDLALERNYSLLKLRAQFASLSTLSLDDLAAKFPHAAFLHIHPGKVKTGFLSRSVTWTVLKVLVGYFLEPMMMSIGGITTEECGERMLWMALSEHRAKGSWSLDFEGNESQSEELARYRRDRLLSARIAAHVEQAAERLLHSTLMDFRQIRRPNIRIQSTNQL